MNDHTNTLKWDLQTFAEPPAEPTDNEPVSQNNEPVDNPADNPQTNQPAYTYFPGESSLGRR